MAEFIVDVVVGVVTHFRFILTVAIAIVERCKIMTHTGDRGTNYIGMGRPFLDDLGDDITVFRVDSSRFLVVMMPGAF